MKKSILLFSFYCNLYFLFAQGDSTLSPSARFGLFPQANSLSDSVTFFSKDDLKKNKPAMMMVFNPDCEHCQHETTEITMNIEKFKGIQIVMSSMVTISEIKKPLSKSISFQNMTISQLEKMLVIFLPAYYQFHNLPFLAFYDKKHKLISEFSGSLPIEKVLKVFEK
ncbi:MAG: redoxin domain-containing protein [Chitinophagaceae bacterium]|nr:redoxin domain-containing protein [Chitinophagaceae bacterium]